MAEILGESVVKPVWASGSRRVQRKSRACDAVIMSYSSIISHLEDLPSENLNTNAANFGGYLLKLKSCDLVLNLLFF